MGAWNLRVETNAKTSLIKTSPGASQLGANKHPVDAEGVGFTPRIGVSRRPTCASLPRSQTLPVIE